MPVQIHVQDPYVATSDTDLGQLAANRRKYANDPDPDLREVYQPQRTDLEPPLPGQEVRYLEVQLDPLDE